MLFSEVRLPSQVSYFFLVAAQFLELLCRIALTYSAMILILFLPVSISLLQWGSAMIEKPAVIEELRHQYALDAVGIIVTGKIYSTTYNENEVSHLLDVRKVLFGLVSLTIVMVMIFFYFCLNRQRFVLLHSSVLLRNAAIIILLLTILIAVFFPYFFVLMHSLLFPQGNYVFPLNSPLIEAFPLSYWLLTFLCLQGGVIGALLVQTWWAHRKEM